MARKPTDQAADAARQSGEAMSDTMRSAADRMQATGSAMAESSSQLGTKMLDQAEANTQEAFKAMRAAAQANDVSEVMRIQAEYLREQGSRSVAQAREIGELIASFGRSAIGSMTRRD